MHKKNNLSYEAPTVSSQLALYHPGPQARSWTWWSKLLQGSWEKILLPSRQMWKHPVVSVGIVLIPQVQTPFPSIALIHTRQCPKTLVDHFKRKRRDINSCIPHIPPLFRADCPLFRLIVIRFFLPIKPQDRLPCFLGIRDNFLLCIIISSRFLCSVTPIYEPNFPPL